MRLCICRSVCWLRGPLLTAGAFALCPVGRLGRPRSVWRRLRSGPKAQEVDNSGREAHQHSGRDREAITRGKPDASAHL